MLRWTSAGVLDARGGAHEVTVTLECLPDGAPVDVQSVRRALSVLPTSHQPSAIRVVAGVVDDVAAGTVALHMHAPTDTRVLPSWAPENGASGRAAVENAPTPFAWRIAALVAAGAVARDTLAALGVEVRARCIAVDALWDRSEPDVRAAVLGSRAGFADVQAEVAALELLAARADNAHAATFEVCAFDVPGGVGDGYPLLAELGGGLLSVPCAEGVALHLDGLVDGVTTGAPLALRVAVYAPSGADVLALRHAVLAVFALHTLRAFLARLGDRWMVNTMVRVSAWRRELEGRKTLPPPPPRVTA